MTEAAMTVPNDLGEFSSIIPHARNTKEALARLCAVRWPFNRRKHVERTWGLTEHEARSVCDGEASDATQNKIWRHKDGAIVALPVVAAVAANTTHAGGNILYDLAKDICAAFFTNDSESVIVQLEGEIRLLELTLGAKKAHRERLQDHWSGDQARSAEAHDRQTLGGVPRSAASGGEDV